MADFRKSAMLKLMLGKKDKTVLAELALPIAVANLNVFKEENNKYSAHCNIAQELPGNLNGKSLFLRGEDEGVAVESVKALDAKKLEFEYAGTATITGSQYFFSIKEYELLPLNKWSNVNQAVWWIEQAKISQIQGQLSPLGAIVTAINTVYQAEAVYKNDLKLEGKNRQAGDRPYNAKEALENVRIIEECMVAIEPLEAFANEYDLVPTATMNQVQAQLKSCWSACIQVALNMNSQPEFETIDEMDADDCAELYNMIRDALDGDVAIKAQAEASSGADEIVPDADLSEDAQKANEGKPRGECTLEQRSELPGASAELSEEELEALTNPLS